MRDYTQALLASGLFSVLCVPVAAAAEVSMVSGFYRSEATETTDPASGSTVSAGKKSTIDIGGRFADQLDTHMFWFGQGMLTLKSYEKGDVGTAPSDTTSLSLGGGVRYYFGKLSESISPFVYGLGQYKNEQDGEVTTVDAGATAVAASVETEKNGLFYGAAFGIRLSLGPDFFVDMETPLFESALFATETEETTPATGAKQTDETKKTELYANTSGALSSVVIALGMRL